MEQYIASLYQNMYTLLVTALSIPIINRYKNLRENSKVDNSRVLVIVFLIAIAIGLRPVSGRYFVDMIGYSRVLDTYDGSFFFFNWDTDNIIFDNLLFWWASSQIGKTLFFLFMSCVYFGSYYWGIKRLFPKHELAAYVVFLAAFSTFSFATNGIKAGVAASIFVLALAYSNNKLLSLLFAFVSLGFHHSMQLPVAALILTMFFKNPKWYFYGWFFCLLMAMLHITYFQNLFGGMTDEQGAGYLLVTTDETVGGIRFRPDFIIYSAMPVWIGYQFEMKMKQTSKIYSTLLHFYLCTNGIWMLCMYASFNNRIAYLSWFIYPIVLIYPFLYIDERPMRYQYFSKTMKYHLYFTLFMVFIYYGLFGFGN